ncbi:YgfZ/GcvT domain-containing protein [Deinococcus sp. Marseille-Q6407]|uniref:CAF17-like 4Fe-4S cluster assembly/insertion protein YgfZ n=1 Tax=Deinococcus sp. Marseille-Q6407 TaxID=2969223 RepID=UPI0021C057D0|nr:folate-binding protein [Deinococcus sp. Marseille-Q6407]
MSTFFTPVPSGALRVTGSDRLDFVQGQMTNDLRSCPVPGYVAACFLNVRGQTEQFARIYRRPNDIYLHLDTGQAPELAARLRRYVIFDQVEIEDLSDDLRTLHLWGRWPAAPQLAGWPQEAAQLGAAWTVQLGEAQVLLGAVNRSGQTGLDLHYLARQEAQVLEHLRAGLTLSERSWDDLQAARVAAGLPDPVADGFLGFLPQEVGLDLGGPLPAISYRKGCYVGQEIMARLEARGQARYGLSRLQVPAGTPVRSEVQSGSRTVGQTGLEAGGLALCRLRLDLPADAALTVNGQPVALAAGSLPSGDER